MRQLQYLLAFLFSPYSLFARALAHTNGYIYDTRYSLLRRDTEPLPRGEDPANIGENQNGNGEGNGKGCCNTREI